jgi:hypothetical protein
MCMEVWECGGLRQYCFDAVPNPILHFDDDRDLTPSFSHVEKSEFFYFIHSNARLLCFIIHGNFLEKSLV